MRQRDSNRVADEVPGDDQSIREGEAPAEPSVQKSVIPNSRLPVEATRQGKRPSNALGQLIRRICRGLRGDVKFLNQFVPLDLDLSIKRRQYI